MSNLKKINDYRINYSSHIKIYLDEKITKKINFNNKKLFNLNNFTIDLYGKKINYSLLYTNPFQVDKKIINKILIDSDSEFKTNPYKKIINKLCYEIFVNKSTLSKYDKDFLEELIRKKYKNNEFIELKETFLILWYIINNSKYVNEKILLNQLTEYYYFKYINGEFNFNDIIYNILNLSENIDYVKFYIGFYVLAEEFHYKYLYYWFNKNKLKIKNYFMNSNYVKINPQEILTNSNGQYYPNVKNLIELIQIPLGHNILLIFNNLKVYYYDSDEVVESDIYKLKRFFFKTNINFINISNRDPIQTIFDDGNCLFYCIRLIQYIIENNIKIDINSLKLAVLKYEKLIYIQNDMFIWIQNYL